MPFVKKASWEASRSLAARSIQRKWRSRKSDKHIAKVAVKAVMRKAETKSFISANQSRSMTDDFFYYQNSCYLPSRSRSEKAIEQKCFDNRRSRLSSNDFD